MTDALFHDYANWILESSDLVEALKEKNSLITERFKHVFDVLEFLYTKKIEEKSLQLDEQNIFETGFYYVFDAFENIKLVLEHDYKGNIEELDRHAKTVILLLDTLDFQNELIGAIEEPNESHMQSLIDIEHEILTILEKKEDASQELHEKLDHVTEGIYKELELDFYPIGNIFFDIADELGLL
ncbi:hypothetical protein JN09_000451 [Acholeplasma morum]|uniref:hypothetical protein n=1 Tax=Paracholeplasma morum TaxID=264637 RepID=UPI00195BD21F|nr:hypothetical protein [Paracholeplasma morum]MBM7453129.1 hypothetical protein [Paracholeplasma morum]